MSQEFYNLQDSDQKTAYEQFMKVTRDAFVDAFKEVLPGTDNKEIYWHFHVMISMLISISSSHRRLELISEDEIKESSSRELCEKIVQYSCSAIAGSHIKEPYEKSF